MIHIIFSSNQFVYSLHIYSTFFDCRELTISAEVNINILIKRLTLKLSPSRTTPKPAAKSASVDNTTETSFADSTLLADSCIK